MASADWHGKYKGGTQAKAQLAHNDKEMRLTHDHDNPDINKMLTSDNYSYYGLSYRQKCAKYDKQVNLASQGVRLSSGKNANVTLQVVLVYPPDGMDSDTQWRWYRRIGDMAADRWGDNFIDMDVHVDEVHQYLDSKTGTYVQSKVHGHLTVVPTDDSGKLNGKAFASRKNIQDFNAAVEQMTQIEFGRRWNNGAGKHASRSVEQMKSESTKLAIAKGANDMIANIKARETKLIARERNLDDRERNLNIRERAVVERERVNDAKERKLRNREYAVAERERVNDAQEQQINALLSSPKSIFQQYIEDRRLKADFDQYIQDARNRVKRPKVNNNPHSGAAARVLADADYIQSRNSRDNQYGLR